MTSALALYQDLHAHPELAGAERGTAERLAGWLRRAEFETTTGVGGHGVVGVLRNGPGPVVMLRAELDALPIAEETGLAYASTHAEVMHACGHDLHLAALAGTATVLAACRDSWRGTVLAVGQPAEETLTGARAMLDDNLFDRFGRPDAVLAQHTAPLPAGMVAHGQGPMLAGSLTLAVTIPGVGGHAGTPHLCVDPVVTAASIVLQLQTVVSRHVGPSEPAVLTVGQLRSEGPPNAIASRVRLTVTMRAFADSTLDRMAETVTRIVRAGCQAAGAPTEPTIEVLSRSPVTWSDPGLTTPVRNRHLHALGAERVAWWPPSMATEDYGRYAAAGVPCAYWMLGSIGPRQWAEAPGDTAAEKLAALPGNHSPKFAPYAELALPTGITALTTAALTHLGS